MKPTPRLWVAFVASVLVFAGGVHSALSAGPGCWENSTIAPAIPDGFGLRICCGSEGCPPGTDCEPVEYIIPGPQPSTRAECVCVTPEGLFDVAYLEEHGKCSATIDFVMTPFGMLASPYCNQRSCKTKCRSHPDNLVYNPVSGQWTGEKSCNCP